MPRSSTPLPAPVVYDVDQAAAYLGLPTPGALRMMIFRETAPPRIAYGKRDIRFRVIDLDAWLAAKAAANQRRAAIAEATAEPPPKRRPGRPTKAESIARRKRDADQKPPT